LARLYLKNLEQAGVTSLQQSSTKGDYKSYDEKEWLDMLVKTPSL
jgi:hypothetical protein